MPEPSLLELLELEKIEEDLYRANAIAHEDYPLYGGQVAAQALRAAGLTVDPARRPHSLHGYFLRAGDSDLPTVLKVYRDRDGRSFSARRVVAIQHGAVIFSMSASFQHYVPSEQVFSQTRQMPETQPPESCETGGLFRLRSMQVRQPDQPLAGRARWATRFWACADFAVADDPLLHACVLAYLSDVSTGVLPAQDGSAGPGASLDHALWFHAPVDMNEWVLSDYHPQIEGNGRGWYTGAIFTRDGTLVASIAQEALYR